MGPYREDQLPSKKLFLATVLRLLYREDQLTLQMYFFTTCFHFCNPADSTRFFLAEQPKPLQTPAGVTLTSPSSGADDAPDVLRAASLARRRRAPDGEWRAARR